MSDWAVIGTSESAAECLHCVPDDVRIIACNAAIRLFDDRRLDVYFLFDNTSCVRHGAEAYEKQKSGTWLVTVDYSKRILERHGLLQFDEFLTYAHAVEKPFVRGIYQRRLALSGMHSLAYAVNNGATRIFMLGMEGYENRTAGKVKLIIEPITQEIVNTCTDIDFLFFGTPRYRIGGANLTIHRDAHAYQNAQAV